MKDVGLRIRVQRDLREAFLEACGAQDKPAAQVLREYMGEYVADHESDMVRFEQVNQEVLTEDMTEMLRNNPPDVVYAAFRDAFFKGAIRMFQRDNEMRNIVLTDLRPVTKPPGISSTGR